MEPPWRLGADAVLKQDLRVLVGETWFVFDLIRIFELKIILAMDGRIFLVWPLAPALRVAYFLQL